MHLGLSTIGRRLAPDDLRHTARLAESLGYDSLWTAEGWGADAFTPLGFIAATTSRLRLGTAIAQIAARTPAATAMTALTLQQLSGGRLLLGLGVSGPQVVEGWHGVPFRRPLAATRDYVAVLRQALAAEAEVQHAGEIYCVPYRGEGADRARPPAALRAAGRAGDADPRRRARTEERGAGGRDRGWAAAVPVEPEPLAQGLGRGTGRRARGLPRGAHRCRRARRRPRGVPR